MTAPPLLDVTRSFTDRLWQGTEADARIGLALAQRLGVSEITGRLLAARGIGLDDAPDYLDPTLRRLLPDPGHLLDMERAAIRLADAIRDGEPIAIFGDYDVDGATSSALLIRFLRALGVEATLYIPDRQAEGYGPNAPALEGLARAGARLVITVDCGATASAPLAAARAAGLDVIVCDHHAGEPALPPAVAVVNPNRVDETSPHRHLAAVGVAFLLVIATNRVLRARGWYKGRTAPDLMHWLDLVALGTVADVVPLTGVNRALVAQGLKVLANRANEGLAALSDIAGLNERPDAWHLGFMLGPRVNAGGRVGRSDLGARLLACDDPAAARALAEELDRLNSERRAIEAAVLDAAITQAEGQGTDRAMLVVGDAGWHPGVIGIVASRLKDRYHRPVFVLSRDGALAKGSGRSLKGFHLGDATLAARQAGLLINGGGHAMAAGLTVPCAQIPALTDFFEARALAALGPPGALRPRLTVDAVVALGGANSELLAEFTRLAPFGAGNPEPRIALPDCAILRADPVGQTHLRLILGGGAAGGRLKAICFRAFEGPLGEALRQRAGARVHIAGHLRADTWQGRNDVQLIVDDAAPAG